MININELNLNDSILLDIELRQGQVRLSLDYIDDYVTQYFSKKTLVFLDCSKFVFDMHCCFDSFGAILCGKQKYLKDCTEYIIEMNTTASIMTVHAQKLILRMEESPTVKPPTHPFH